MEFIFRILGVILLVLLNGFFVASEFALIGVRKTRIQELSKQGNVTAKLIKKALDDLDSYISATQLGITVASLGLGWVGEPAIAQLIEPFLLFVMGEQAAFFTAHSLAVTTAFLIITFLHIVFGELAPKTMALERAEKVSFWVIIPLTAFNTVFKPFIYVLNNAGKMVLKVFGIKAPSGHQLVHSEEEIRMLLAQSSREGVIPKREVEMVKNVFNLGDIAVRDIMVPKNKMISFDDKLTLNEVSEVVEKELHSRYPVYKKSLNQVVGFVHIKDFYQQMLDGKGGLKLSQTENIIRKIPFVADITKVDQVLRDMRKKKVHMAMVVKGNRVLGMVTLEDAIESLVGEIEDEFE